MTSRLSSILGSSRDHISTTAISAPQHMTETTSDLPKWKFSPGRESWLAISAVVLSLTLSHLVQRIKAKRLVSTRISSLKGSHADVLSPSDTYRSTLLPAIKARIDTLLYLYIIPPWLYAPESIVDAIWTGSYCIMMLFCAIYQCPISQSQLPYLYLANRLGILAYAQTPLIFLLAVKNNPLSPLTGITYQKLNHIHRASARACIIFAWLHTILWFLPVLYAGHLFHWYVIWGTIALLAFTGLWATSVRTLRRRSFEFFLVTHILFSAAFILGAILHWPLKAYWIWPSLAIWVLDRLIRFIRLAYINKIHRRNGGAPAKDCIIETVSRDVMRLTVVRHGLKWEAGQHFFLSAPSIGGSIHESHPFTIANIPNSEGEIIFLIRAHSGFTRRLIDHSPLNPPILLEGPYGHSHHLNSYHSILFISGGTGVTFTLSHFLALLSDIRAGKAITKRIKLVWHVRHAEDMYWITGMLNQALSTGEAGNEGRTLRDMGVKIEVEVWVTRSKASAEPWEDASSGTIPGTPMDVDTPICNSAGGSEDPIRVEGGGSEGSSNGNWGESTREMSEVNEMTRLLPRLGRSGSSISIKTSKRGISITPIRINSPSRPDTSHLPSHTFLHNPSPNHTSSHSSSRYISAETQRIISLHPGRADLLQIVTDMSETTSTEGGGMIVVACGPVALMNDTRNAVGMVNSWGRIRGGKGIVEFFEETVGH